MYFEGIHNDGIFRADDNDDDNNNDNDDVRADNTNFVGTNLYRPVHWWFHG